MFFWKCERVCVTANRGGYMPPINTARRSITFVFLLTFRVLFRCSADYGTLQLHLQSDKSTANRIAGFPRKAAKGLNC